MLTLVVQEGHLLGLTGLDRTGPIETFVPPIAFAILFGLSMDYMVFLMSRIREEHVHGLQTRAAVEHGIAAIGRVVVAAALIMGTVFAAFILSADRIPKEFGLLLAVAILTDALIVRMTLVPAFLTLLGERSWYIPRWLDRLLPNITIEPPHDRPQPALRGRRSAQPRLVKHERGTRSAPATRRGIAETQSSGSDDPRVRHGLAARAGTFLVHDRSLGRGGDRHYLIVASRAGCRRAYAPTWSRTRSLHRSVRRSERNRCSARAGLPDWRSARSAFAETERGLPSDA